MKLYTFLKGNIEALETASPATYAWLTSQNYDLKQMEENVFVNETGALDWRLPDGQGIFEPIPPLAYYQSWKTEDRPHTSATVLIGANLGYGLNHLLVNTPDSHKIILLEPRAEVLMACLGQTDYRQFMEIKKLHIMPPSEEYLLDIVQNLDLHFLYGRIYLREDLPCKQIGPEYAKWGVLFRKRLDSFSVELTTLRCKQDVMVGNELKNFQRAVTDGSLKSIKGAGNDVTAVIFGAGPSLGEYAPKLKGKLDNSLVVTGVQTLPAMQQHGITPDFCLGLDYDGSMLRIFNRLDMEAAATVPLIYSTKMAPEFIEKYPGPTIPLWTMGGISTYLFGENELVLDAGGNVGVTLFRLLDYMGVGRTVLVGQDLAVIGEATHVEGHHAHGGDIQNSPIFNVKTRNSRGDELITSSQLLAAKRDLEDDISKTSSEVINLYGGGAMIEGSREVTFEELVQEKLLVSSEGSLEHCLKRMEQVRLPMSRPVFEQRHQQWSKSLRSVEKRLNKLFKRPEKNQEEIKEVMCHVEMFLKQDRLYTPYLYNEIMDMCELSRAKLRYERKEFSRFKQIAKRASSKVREMDKLLEAPKDAMQQIFVVPGSEHAA